MKFTEHSRILAQWIDEKLQPNIYAVGTLKPRRNMWSGNSRSSIWGCEDRYEAACRQFLCRLTKTVYGKRHWRDNKTLLPCAATLEGNGEGRALRVRPTSENHSGLSGTQSGNRLVRYHLNLMFRRPDWITFEEFQCAIAEGWQKSPWAMPDIKIEQRLGDCVGYSLKEGPETLLTSVLSF